MPQADTTHTPIYGAVATVAALVPFTFSRSTGRSHAIEVACRDALATHVALRSLAMSRPRQGPIDPAYRETCFYLTQRWEKQLGQVCDLAANGGDGLRLKASLLQRLVAECDPMQRGPLVALADSVSRDILVND